jgi:hypothetical protein
MEAPSRERRRGISNARRDGWVLGRVCECERPLTRLVGGHWYITTVCLRCRRRARLEAS